MKKKVKERRYPPLIPRMLPQDVARKMKSSAKSQDFFLIKSKRKIHPRIIIIKKNSQAT